MNGHLLIYVAVVIAAALLVNIFRSRGDWLEASPAEGNLLKEFGKNIRLRDLFRLAAIMEEDGRDFYLKMAEKALDKKTRELCQRLAGEETEHMQLFLNRLSHWKPLAASIITWPSFLKKVKQEGFLEDAPDENSSEDQMAEYAIQQEIKAARFYQMFETAFPEAWKRVHIQQLVLQERSHEAELRAAYPHLSPKKE